MVVEVGDAAELGGVADAGSLPIVVIGVGRSDQDPPGVFDLVLADDDPLLDGVLATVEHNPVAARSLAVLLRATTVLGIDHALAAESAVYSTLQGGAEFARWRAASTHRPPAPTDRPAAIASRSGDTLHIVLDRPARHNAFGRDMRDAVSEALALAVADDSIQRIELSGNGPSFCSGGDLGEFGTFTDPADAHVTRLSRSPARLMARLAERTHARIHGACMGAGIELPAFAGHVSAHPDSAIALPELSLGLIPGAGGTVSITRRVGRQRCALLALCGRPISASTALEWGLIDEISPTMGVASRP
ncbi:MAG: hypothetical protein JWL72_252 [Ilumatobacteraceae bacterium]|nr:hypothetical protein [Ilumatobacteraceae bacterium]MCU1386914.1 hypothetical protein [Ilumatobacteraceae bacterium]